MRTTSERGKGFGIHGVETLRCEGSRVWESTVLATVFCVSGSERIAGLACQPWARAHETLEPKVQVCKEIQNWNQPSYWFLEMAVVRPVDHVSISGYFALGLSARPLFPPNGPSIIMVYTYRVFWGSKYDTWTLWVLHRCSLLASVVNPKPRQCLKLRGPKPKGHYAIVCSIAYILA